MERREMSRIKKILVAVDFSVYSVNIANYARGIAEDLKAKLVFVNVINKRDIHAIKQAFVYHSENLSVDDYFSKLRRERAEKLKKLMEKTSCANITQGVVGKCHDIDNPSLMLRNARTSITQRIFRP